MKSEQLFFVRYAPGSAGNFLISLLQSTTGLAHWNLSVEQHKNNLQFEKIFTEDFKNNFRNNLNEHIKHEPHHPYQLDFISAKHPRGDDLSFEQFVYELEQRQDPMIGQLQNNQRPVLRLNKNLIPKFGQGGSVVNIIIDPSSRKWFNRVRFLKLFGYTNGIGISKENHPLFLQAKYKKIQFDNQYQFEESFYSFVKHRVINDPAIKDFLSADKLLLDPSNKTCKQYNILLSDLLNPNVVENRVCEIANYFDLGPVNIKLVDKCTAHFYNTNVKPFENKL